MHIKEYLESTGLSLTQFHELCEVSIPQLSLYCRAIRLPGAENMKKIIKASRGKISASDQYLYYVDNKDKK